ncbi:hypothetical protein NMY3_02039 [Candidatus Nitrosocosmicus oleophilus]|uniref:Uncharacterized protein n=1 Tax=Candidatus Nitrosocosmicus oleophilus TaxID=1353260 RepID=A0A654M119_9ARCH|nr:hypothetical protein [Candidatus Nitrosocosmicus oleophilus]ALI36241.1 hypothetical protein NMY3_02039 [Candidatus Nitrosocosmicus oleophilus]
MSNMNSPLSTENSRAIVMEPTIKSISFLKFLKKSANDLLKSNEYKPKSIKTEGFYVIIFLRDDSQLVQATELLRKISGVSYVFIAAVLKLEYDTLSRSILSIATKLVMNGEKYLIKIETSKLTKSKDDEFTYFKHDLEFFIQTELSSQVKGLIPVQDESHADKILYILIGNDIALISLLVLKGSDCIPFNFLQTDVACPIYDDCSLLSLVQVLDSGYMPMPVLFFDNQLDLIQKIRKFDEIIRNYPIEFVTFYLISMQDTQQSSVRPTNRASRGHHISKEKGNPIQSLIYEQVIIQILLRNDFDSFFVSFPFVPFIHPNWFIQKNIKLFNQSKKILLTPLLFGCPPQAFEKNLTKLVGLNSTINQGILIRNYLDDSEPKDFAEATDRYTKSINTGDFEKFSLNVRKNDIFDILDSV